MDCGQLRAGLLRIAASRRHSALTVDSDPGLLRTPEPCRPVPPFASYFVGGSDALEGMG